MKTYAESVVENARRYLHLPTVDADSKRVIRALLRCFDEPPLISVSEPSPVRASVAFLAGWEAAQRLEDHEWGPQPPNTHAAAYAEWEQREARSSVSQTEKMPSGCSAVQPEKASTGAPTDTMEKA